MFCAFWQLFQATQRGTFFIALGKIRWGVLATVSSLTFSTTQCLPAAKILLLGLKAVKMLQQFWRYPGIEYFIIVNFYHLEKKIPGKGSLMHMSTG